MCCIWTRKVGEWEVYIDEWREGGKILSIRLHTFQLSLGKQIDLHSKIL